LWYSNGIATTGEIMPNKPGKKKKRYSAKRKSKKMGY